MMHVGRKLRSISSRFSIAGGKRRRAEPLVVAADFAA
jgi:hypothetical protein